MEFWTSTAAVPTRSAHYARQAEAAGWTGWTVVDSQNLSGDSYVCLALGANATERLGVMTSVTNPVTRQAATTASAALSVQKVSNGRMVLGIGRGDSALAHLGRAPARLRWFERYLENVQSYLRGEPVDFALTQIPDEAAPLVDTLGLAEAPAASAIDWPRDTPKVPVEVAATGPKVIGLAARHADRVLLAVGAEPKRIEWGVSTARQAAEAHGRDPDSVGFGAYVTVVCTDDLDAGRHLGRASSSLFARFSVMHGTVSGPADDSQRDVFRNVHERYDMTKHAQAGGEQTTALTDEFLDTFAIIGPAGHCIERLEALRGLGVDKFCVTGPNFASRPGPAADAAADFAENVMGPLRS